MPYRKKHQVRISQLHPFPENSPYTSLNAEHKKAHEYMGFNFLTANV